MTITRNYLTKIYGALTPGGSEAVLATGTPGAWSLTCSDSFDVYGLTVNGTTPNSGDLVYELSPAPASAVLAGQTNLGVAGTLPVAKVMQSVGGSIATQDVLNIRTGVAAGGTDPGAAAQLVTDQGTVAGQLTTQAANMVYGVTVLGQTLTTGTAVTASAAAAAVAVATAAASGPVITSSGAFQRR